MIKYAEYLIGALLGLSIGIWIGIWIGIDLVTTRN